MKNLFELKIKTPPCIAGVSEDDIRALLDSIEVTITDPTLSNFVTSTFGTQVKFNFGSDGNFNSVTAKLNGKIVTLIQGAGGNELQVFKGAPSVTNPGYGWTVETDLTKQYLGQPDNENNWVIFFASRARVLNVV